MTNGSPAWSGLDLDSATIPATVIHNVFVHSLKELDTEIWQRHGRTPSRDEIISFVENIKHEIFRKSKTVFKAQGKPDKKALPDVPDSRNEFYARKSSRPSTT